MSQHPSHIDYMEPPTGPELPPGGLREPDSGPIRHALRSSWRRLPLTAQLTAIGVLVALAWFVTARYAASRAEEAAVARNMRLERIHQAEVVGTRMLSAALSMSNAHRGFLLTGDALFRERYQKHRRQFDVDVALLNIQAGMVPEMRPALRRVVDRVAEFDRNLAQPTWARGRAAAGSERLNEAIAAMDGIRDAHAALQRILREQSIEIILEAETAAATTEWETFLLRTAAVAMFILLLSVTVRTIESSLRRVMVAAEALDAGRFDQARLPAAHRAPNREMAVLTRTFDRLTISIEARERQLQEDIGKLKELESVKSDFVSTVSHELRTPLTSVRGALGLMLGGAAGELAPKGRELLRIALTNTDRLIRLINDILDIEKIDAGHVQIRHARLRLKPLLVATAAQLDGLAHDARVTLRVTQVDDVEVIGDADRLTQVFTNLVSNAVKFSPAGADVEISARAANGEVTIGVRDHGPGIPPEFRSRIFGRFQQAGGAESRQSGGTGLGLSIARAITELHAGRIGFEDAEGGGTTFVVTLPIAARSMSDQDQRPTVLIVEDDSSMRDVLCAMLEPFAQPVAVEDAETALETLQRIKARVVIVDTGLPGMDGLTLARTMRADPRLRTLAILVYSASDFNAKDLRAAGIRIADAFVKTRDSEASLVERVRRELQGQG